jgi:hypothetical protein
MLKRNNKIKLIIDLIEMVIVAIFAALNWTSLLPLFPVYSRAYWLIFGLTVAYLILLFVKFLRKYVYNGGRD